MAARSRWRPGWTDWPRAGLGGGGAPEVCSLWRYALPYTRATRLEHRAGPVLRGGAGGGLPDQLVSFGDIAERDVFLEVSINGANTSQLLRFRDAQGRLSASADALRSVGIDVPGRRRRWQSGVAAGCDSGLALQLQRRDAVGEPGGAGRLAHALSTRHARRPQGAAGHQRARAGAELRRLRADQRPVPVVAVYRAALFQSVRRIQQHRHHLCRRAGGPLYPL